MVRQILVLITSLLKNNLWTSSQRYYRKGLQLWMSTNTELILYESPASQRWRNYSFWSISYSAALKITSLAETFSLLQPCILPLQRWFCISFWFYLQTLTCQGSLPLMLLCYVSGLPAEHTLASSSLFNFLKSSEKDVLESQQLKSAYYLGEPKQLIAQTEKSTPLWRRLSILCGSPSRGK